MDIESYRTYCLSLNGVTEDYPFGERTLVVKVKGKIVTLADVDSFDSFTVKCDPAKAVKLRESYPAVQPGYHMNKKHWNTIEVDNSIPDELLCEWIRDSYELVRDGLTGREKRELLRE
ncbi:MAG: MmcQ/YjbR family DNA-binding protein [Balneolales bacterium]